MKKYSSKIVLFASIITFSISLHAYEVNSKGFLTFAYSQSDNKSVYEGRINDEGEFSNGTKAGLQFSSILSPKVDAFMQLLADGDNGRDFNFSLDIAHVNYNINDSHKVLYGKIRLPVFMISDYRQVGSLYPWINPPEEVYKIVPLEDIGASDTFFGISIEGNIFHSGLQQMNYRVYTGGSETVAEKDKDNVDGGEAEIKIKNLYGVLVDYHYDDFYLKLSHLRVNSEGERFDFDDEVYKEKEPFGTNFTSFGMKYDNDYFMLMSEFVKINGETKEVNHLESYYIMGGLYLSDNDILIHTTVADILETSKTNQEIFQKTVAFGLNYNLDLATVLKFEHKLVDVKNKPRFESGDNTPREAGFFERHPRRPVKIFSVSINTMF
jgi:hypothetical protein